LLFLVVTVTTTTTTTTTASCCYYSAMCIGYAVPELFACVLLTTMPCWLWTGLSYYYNC